MYRNFRLQIIFRIVLICIAVNGFLYLLLMTRLYASATIVGMIAVYLVYSLIHYSEKTNQNLSRFLQAIRYADFSQSFTGSGLGSSFEELNATFAEVIKDFQRIRAEKEEHYRYLQTVVQHVGIGLIAFQEGGEVVLINNAAKRLLNVSQILNLTMLGSFSPSLVQTLFAMKSGDKTLVKVWDEDELLQLVIYATEFRLGGDAIKLVSIQNIQSELEEKEMESWQKLIRVLTHEIMNSVTPISSLASTANEMLSDGAPGNLQDENSAETIADVRSAVQTIQKRSEGLLHFVQAYRSLTRLPKPNFQIFPVRELFARVQQMTDVQYREKQIDVFSGIEPPGLELTADMELIEQVLLNLLKNAAEAVDGKTDAKIRLSARLDSRGRVIIQVSDNGTGITEEAQDKIFIPFFTTKKEGSGIGLSLSRQIMRLHRGNISVYSQQGTDTVFTLRF
jgi:two-component system, NtrC family, nitrogen regulation sensor histidine kinase NtrY